MSEKEKLELLEKLKTAYDNGFRRGYSESKEQFDYMFNKLAHDLPVYEKKIADKFNLELQLIELKPLAIDFNSGKPMIMGSVYRLPTLTLSFKLIPEKEYVIVPGDYIGETKHITENPSDRKRIR